MSLSPGHAQALTMPSRGRPWTGYAAFRDPGCRRLAGVAVIPVLSEAEFEVLGRKHLQMLHDNDEPVWDPHNSCDPYNPRSAFSLAQRAFFVAGFHVQASRLSRRFVYPAIVFNPESQIRRLKADDQFGTVDPHVV
jgi:hypothetical protein